MIFHMSAGKYFIPASQEVTHFKCSVLFAPTGSLRHCSSSVSKNTNHTKGTDEQRFYVNKQSRTSCEATWCLIQLKETWKAARSFSHYKYNHKTLLNAPLRIMGRIFKDTRSQSFAGCTDRVPKFVYINYFIAIKCINNSTKAIGVDLLAVLSFTN